MVDYLQKGATMTSDCYCELLHRLRDELKSKRPGCSPRKFSFTWITHGFTSRQNLWRKSTNVDFNYFPPNPIVPNQVNILCIHLIWHHRISPMPDLKKNLWVD